MSHGSMARPVVGRVPPCPWRDRPAGSPSHSEPDAAGVLGAREVLGEVTCHPG